MQFVTWNVSVDDLQRLFEIFKCDVFWFVVLDLSMYSFDSWNFFLAFLFDYS